MRNTRKIIRGKVKSLLRKMKLNPSNSNWGLANAAAQAFKIDPPKANSKGVCYDVFEEALFKASLDGFVLPNQPKVRVINRPKKVDEVDKPDAVREFYASYEWRKLRLTIIEKHGRRCLCCGATPEDGITIHVDHIKPLRFNWNLRLDPSNLQVLCSVCNHGKGNWNTTDFRQA